MLILPAKYVQQMPVRHMNPFPAWLMAESNESIAESVLEGLANGAKLRLSPSVVGQSYAYLITDGGDDWTLVPGEVIELLRSRKQVRFKRNGSSHEVVLV